MQRSSKSPLASMLVILELREVRSLESALEYRVDVMEYVGCPKS